MPSNKRRYAESIPVLYICIVIAVMICFGTFGIKTLLLKQQIKQGGERLSLLRKQLSEVATSNECLVTEKETLTSIPALTAAIKAGIIKLKPIEPRFVLNIPSDRNTVAATAGLPGSEGGR